MNQQTTPAASADESQRAALEQSEKHASEAHPDNFKDEETDEKIVEIGPDMTEAPIKGIDPDAPKSPATRAAQPTRTEPPL